MHLKELKLTNIRETIAYNEYGIKSFKFPKNWVKLAMLIHVMDAIGTVYISCSFICLFVCLSVFGIAIKHLGYSHLHNIHN